MLVEIGGTVGDIESLPFVEAIRQLRQDVGRENTLYIHLTLVPFIGAAGELKTKPTQHSVRDLRAIGIQPDILLCRTDRFLDQDIKQKIALFCDVDEEAVITAKDVSSIYEVPLVLAAEGLDRIVLNRLHLPQTEARMGAWIDLVDRIKNPSDEITIHVVGKYVGYEDSYKSLNEALYHGGFKHRLRVNIRWVEAEALEQPGGEQLLDGANGILVPGGFGDRGTRGMMRAAEIARERGDPVLRDLLRLPVGGGRIRAARLRNVGGGLDRVRARHAAEHHLQAARSARRRRPRRNDAARLIRMRTEAGITGASAVRRSTSIHERHRHRYEFNCLYEKALDRQGAADCRAFARRQVRRDHRAAVASVVRRGAVPPRVQVEAARAASAVCRVRRTPATRASFLRTSTTPPPW